MKKNYRKCIALILTVVILLTSVSPVLASDQRVLDDIWTQDSGLEALTANYGKNSDSPFNSYFSNRNEDIKPQDGGLLLKETDLSLPGRNGMDLQISRVYRNQQANLYQMTTVERSKTNWYYVPPTYGYTMKYVPGWTEYYYVSGYYSYEYVSGYYDWVYVPGWSEWVFEYNWWTNTYYCGYVYHPGYYDFVYVPGYCDWVYHYGHMTSIYHYGYFDYRWGQTASGYYDYYTDYYIDNSTNPKTFLDNVNGLGCGWSFAFPRVENSGNNIFYHAADGGIMQVDFTLTSHLKDYSLMDRVFDNDAGSFTNGQVASKYVMTYKDGKKEYFGSDGRLLGITDRYGNTIKFEHTVLNNYARISRITDSIGRNVDINYSSDRVTVAGGGKTYTYTLSQPVSGKFVLSSVSDPAGRSTGYRYSMDKAQFSFLSRTSRTANNTYANLVEVTHPTGASTGYEYVKGIKNLGGSGSAEYFKVSARHDTVGGSEANKSTFSYSAEPDGFPGYGKDNLPATYTYSATVTGPDGTQNKYTYNNKQLEIRKETSGTGVHTVIQTEYAANSTPQKVTISSYGSGGGSSTTVKTTQYNEYNDLLEEVAPDGVKTTYTYDGKFHLTTSVITAGSSGSKKSEYTLDSMGNTTAEKNYYTKGGALKQVTTLYSYDSFGNKTEARLQMEDGTFRTTSYEYDQAYGSAYQTKIKKSYKDGTMVTSHRYDFNTGLKVSETDAMGKVTSYSYDTLGRVTSTTSPAVEAGTGVKRYSYDDSANMMSVTDENGHSSKYIYDQLGRMKSVQNASGVTVQTRQYDSAGRMTAVTDSSGNSLAAQYDGAGRPVRYNIPDGSSVTLEYNDSDRTVSVRDPRGNVSVTKTDLMGRTVQVSQKPDISGPDVYNTIYGYDFLGNCTRVTQANGKTINYTYNELGRLTGISYPDGKVAPVVFEYNNAGEQVARHDSTSTTYQYNGLGHLLKISYGDGSYAAFTYDLLGRRTSDLSSASGVTSSYTYDALGRKTAQTKSMDGVDYTIRYRYDLAGNLTGIQYPGDDKYLSYRYDSNNRLVEVDGFLDSGHGGGISYYPSGKNKSITFNNGISTTFTYDGRGRLSSIQSPVLNLAYGYDQSGNITAINDNKFSYDGLNRLVQADMPSLGQAETYGYDQVGNRTEETVNGQAAAYSYNSADELVSRGDMSFAYDANGNMSSKTVGGAVYGYNFDSGNRLLGITLNGDEISHYSYDADGVRVKKVENGSTTVYVNSGLEYLLTITDGVPTRHIYAQGRRVAQVTNGETLYVHTDHLGNTRALTDSGGKTVATMEYSPFGAVLKSEGPGDMLKFTGKELDSSRLYYFGARYYDPETGRFISRDPVLSGDTDPTRHNPYVYAQNSPLNLVDPDGKFLPIVLGALSGLASLAAIATESSLLGWAAMGLGVASFGYSAIETYKNRSPQNIIGLGLSALAMVPGASIAKPALSGWEATGIVTANFASKAGLAYTGYQAATYDWNGWYNSSFGSSFSSYSSYSYNNYHTMDFSYPSYSYTTTQFSSPYLSTGYNSYNHNYTGYYGYGNNYGNYNNGYNYNDSHSYNYSIGNYYYGWKYPYSYDYYFQRW